MAFILSLVLYLLILLVLSLGLFVLMVSIFWTNEPAILFLVSVITVHLLLQTAGSIRKRKRWTDIYKQKGSAEE
ncbi:MULTISPECIES: hypothetical protein [Gracilibacillus]|uniref:hypothetical protein n=1 Tax=Gracilibacillus TaxID=74385 RepID=UPI000824F497|nr:MULTISPECIES: hypothetical protein [Gracilibacillus]